MAMDKDGSQVNVDGLAYLEGGKLNLDLANYEIEKGKEKDIVLMTADKIKGKFDQVTAEGYKVTVKYKDGQVLASIKAKK